MFTVWGSIRRRGCRVAIAGCTVIALLLAPALVAAQTAGEPVNIYVPVEKNKKVTIVRGPEWTPYVMLDLATGNPVLDPAEGEVPIFDAEAKRVGAAKLEVSQAPVNGTAKAAADGSEVVYTPKREYVGEDLFTLTVTTGSGRSEERHRVVVGILVIESIGAIVEGVGAGGIGRNIHGEAAASFLVPAALRMAERLADAIRERAAVVDEGTAAEGGQWRVWAGDHSDALWSEDESFGVHAGVDIEVAPGKAIVGVGGSWTRLAVDYAVPVMAEVDPTRRPPLHEVPLERYRHRLSGSLFGIHGYGVWSSVRSGQAVGDGWLPLWGACGRGPCGAGQR